MMDHTLNFQIVAVITKENISSRMPPTFYKSWNPRFGRLGTFIVALPSFLWTVGISMVFLFNVPLDESFSLGAPSLMVVIYECFPLLTSLYLPHVPTYMDFKGDLLLGYSCISLFLHFMYSESRPLLINLLV